jgi:hypothetical protein
MMQVNRESSMPVAELQRLKIKRSKRGECPDCGILLYKTSGLLGRVKKPIPINEVGKCYDGRCLQCLPFGPHEVDQYDDNYLYDGTGKNQPDTTIQPLVTPPTTQVKVAPIPRIILIYQNDGMLLPTTSIHSSGSKLDLSAFGLDFNDDVSDITLDRRIRPSQKGKNMSADINNDSTHRDDDNESLQDEMSERSRSKHQSLAAAAAEVMNPDSIIQGAHLSKMQQLRLRSFPIDHDEPLHIRMARLLEIDIPTNTSTTGHIPVEEIDSKPYNDDNKHHHHPHEVTTKLQNTVEARSDDPEQPHAVERMQMGSSSRLLSTHESFKGIRTGSDHDESQLYEMNATMRSFFHDSLPIPGLSPRHKGTENAIQPSTATTKKVFRPDSLFVSQPLHSPKELPTSTNPHLQSKNIEILLQAPRETGRSNNYNNKNTIDTVSDVFVNPPGIFTVEKPEIVFDAAMYQPDRASRENKLDIYTPKAEVPRSIFIQPEKDDRMSEESQDIADGEMKVEILFDLSAIASQGDERKATKKRFGGTTESHVSEDSEFCFATVNTSSQLHDTDYSAYSSKLLMMLETAEIENDYSIGSTLQSSRIQPINADIDVLSNVDKGNDIPKVIYSSNIEGKLVSESSETDSKLPVVPKNESKNLRGVSPIPEATPSPNTGLRSSSKAENIASKDTPSVSPGSIETSSNAYRKEIEHLVSQLDKYPVMECLPALSRLTELLWMSNENPYIRQEFEKQNGALKLATSIWASMSIPRVQEAALEVFLALITIKDNDSDSVPDKWNDDLSGLIDALLIAMESNIADKKIQILGCRICCCLASTENNANDGTRSGACLAILNAMDSHASEESVQEWGVRALYNQCVLSQQHAETNIRIITTSKLDMSGSTCFDVLDRLARQRTYNMRSGGVLEWVYRLYWCLTADNSYKDDAIPLRMESTRELLMMLEACCAEADSSPQLQEAGLGLITNLMRIDCYKSFLGTPDVVLLIQDTMHGNKEYLEVQIEACNAVASIAIVLAPSDKDELINAGIVRTIVGAMYAFQREKAVLQEPALRALLGLASESDLAKVQIVEPKALSVILQICHVDDDSTQLMQELLCKLLASLYSSDRMVGTPAQSETIGAITSALSTYRNSEQISDASCIAYRNLSRNQSNFEALIRCNAIGLVSRAMHLFIESKSIQISGCWVFWNLGVGIDAGPSEIAEVGALKHIMMAIQTHLDSFEVIDVACGALWSLIHRSNILRQVLFESATGLESIICALVMHPDKVPLLEKICGILAYTSRDLDCIPMGVISSGVSNVVETMYNNPRSLLILQHGAHFLRNAIASQQEHVTESSNVITVLMNALKGCDVPVPFLGEILYFLWVVAETSAQSKEKIIAMDGIPITMSILDQFRGGRVPFVEDPALGLFKELNNETSQRE